MACWKKVALGAAAGLALAVTGCDDDDQNQVLYQGETVGMEEPYYTDEVTGGGDTQVGVGLDEPGQIQDPVDFPNAPISQEMRNRLPIGGSGQQGQQQPMEQGGQQAATHQQGQQQGLGGAGGEGDMYFAPEQQEATGVTGQQTPEIGAGEQPLGLPEDQRTGGTPADADQYQDERVPTPGAGYAAPVYEGPGLEQSTQGQGTAAPGFQGSNAPYGEPDPEKVDPEQNQGPSQNRQQ